MYKIGSKFDFIELDAFISPEKNPLKTFAIRVWFYKKQVPICEFLVVNYYYFFMRLSPLTLCYIDAESQQQRQPARIE